MTNQEKEAAKVMAAHHGLGAMHIPITPARTALVTQYLDVTDDGTVVVVGGEVKATGAHYAVVGTNAPATEPRRMFSAVLSGVTGLDPLLTVERLIEDLAMTHGVDLPWRR
jgi:hypothetical protein